MAAALLLAALLSQVAGEELRKQEYEEGSVSDTILKETKDEVENLKSADTTYFGDQKNAFNAQFTTAESELKEKARELLAAHTANSFKANTDMELATAEYDRIKPLIKTTQYQLKAWLKSALKMYKVEEKAGGRNLAATEKAFSKWMSDSERNFGRYLKGQQKDASKNADKYIKKLEKFGGKTEKDLKGLDKTFEKDKSKIDKVIEKIAETAQETADTGSGAAAELERVDGTLEEKVPKLLESEEEPLGLGPAMSKADDDQASALEGFESTMDGGLDQAALAISDQAQGLATEIGDAGAQAAETGANLEQQVSAYSERGGTLEGLLDQDKAQMRKSMESLIGVEVGKLQQADQKLAAAETKLEATNVSGIEGIDGMSDQMDALIQEFQDYYEKHVDVIKNDAAQQRKVVNTTLGAALQGEHDKVTQQVSIDTQEVLNAFHSELATAEGQMGSMDETLQGTKRKVMTDQKAVSTALGGLARLGSEAHRLPEIGEKAEETMHQATKSPKMERARAEADQVKVDALAYGQEQQKNGVAELGQLGLDLESDLLTASGGMKSAVEGVSEATDEGIESVKQALRPVQANQQVSLSAEEKIKGEIEETATRTKKHEERDEELISDAQSKVQGLEDSGRTAVAEQLQKDTSKVEQSAAAVISSIMKKIESGKKQILTTSDGVRVKATEASEAQQARTTLASKDQRELEAEYNVDKGTVDTEESKIPTLMENTHASFANIFKDLDDYLRAPRETQLAEVKNALEVKSESQVEGLKALEKDRAGEVESTVKNEAREQHTQSSKDLQELQGFVTVAGARVQTAADRAQRDSDMAYDHVSKMIDHSKGSSKGAQALTSAQKAAKQTHDVLAGFPKLVADLEGKQTTWQDTVASEVGETIDALDQITGSKVKSATADAQDGIAAADKAQHAFSVGLSSEYADVQGKTKDVASEFSQMAGTVANEKHMIQAEQQGQEASVATATERMNEDGRLETQRLAEAKLKANKDAAQKESEILELQRNVAGAGQSVAAETQDFVTDMMTVIPKSDPTNDLNTAMARLSEIRSLQEAATKHAYNAEGSVQDRIQEVKDDVEAITEATDAAVRAMSTGKLRAVATASSEILQPVRQILFETQSEIGALVQNLYNATLDAQRAFDRKMDQVDTLIVESEGDAAQLEKMMEYRDEEAVKRVFKHVNETYDNFGKLEKWRDDVMVPESLEWQTAVEEIFGDLGHTLDTDAELIALLGQQGENRNYGSMADFKAALERQVRGMQGDMSSKLHVMSDKVAAMTLGILNDASLSDKEKEHMIHEIRTTAAMMQSKINAKFSSLENGAEREMETIVVGNQKLESILRQAQLVLGKELESGGGQIDDLTRQVREKMRDLREEQQKIENSRPGALLQVREGGTLDAALKQSVVAAETDDAVLERGLSLLEAHLPPARAS